MEVLDKSNQSIKQMIEVYQQKIQNIENKQKQVFKVDREYKIKHPIVSINKAKIHFKQNSLTQVETELESI